ncbi:MAG: nucleotidyltransferase domain-containing protein [Acidobacteria bacterium]|nr:nucleotidyltransferase domain-containing protein [Acidobacteriota bacterium]
MEQPEGNSVVESAYAPEDITAHEVVESYYLETMEGLFFAVKGLEHPPDRWIAVLRYVPDPVMGDREKNGITCRRLYRFAEQEHWIEETCPRYREYDPVFGVMLQGVPRNRVRRIYSPRRQFQRLMQRSDKSALEEDVVSFLSVLQKKAEVPVSSLGITGSVLIGMHTENSDMDVAVFGERSCKRVHRALRGLLKDGGEENLIRLDAEGMEELYAQRVVDTKMGFREFADLENHKANQGRFRGRTWFVRFIKEPGETKERYGSCRYKALGRTRVHASVADDAEAIFTPCRYLLSGVKNVEGQRVPEPGEIVSFRGRFCEQARNGDRVMASGTLEQVRDSRGNVRHRLLLGNLSEDTMIVLR